MVLIIHVNLINNYWYLIFCTPVVANATLTVLDFLWFGINFLWYEPLRGIKKAWFLVPMQHLEKMIN